MCPSMPAYPSKTPAQLTNTPEPVAVGILVRGTGERLDRGEVGDVEHVGADRARFWPRQTPPCSSTRACEMSPTWTG